MKKLTKKEKRNKKIVALVLQKMGLKNTKKNRNLSGKKLDKFNYHKLKLTASKEFDYFELMEYKNKKLDQSLLKWSKKNWDFQKKYGNVRTEEYESFYCQGVWFRAIPKSPFNGKHQKNILYGTLESAESYISFAVGEIIEDFIDKKFPMDFSKHYGKPIFTKIKNSKYTRMQPLVQKTHTYGKMRDRLIKKSRGMYDDIQDYILAYIEPYEGCTFVDKKEGKNNETFIIGGLTAANKINFTTFFYDFYEKEQPIEILTKIIDDISKKYIKILKKY